MKKGKKNQKAREAVVNTLLNDYLKWGLSKEDRLKYLKEKNDLEKLFKSKFINLKDFEKKADTLLSKWKNN